MKASSTILYLLLSTYLAVAGGGIWVLEIDYSLHGIRQTGYVFDYNWDDKFETYIGNDPLFSIEFREKFRNSDSLQIYEKLIDQEKLANMVAFPMHPFFIVENSMKQVRLDEMENLALKKVWKKTDDNIDVLTELSLLDTNWIKNEFSKEYPLGEEVGCRLEVYNFGDKQSHHVLLSDFVVLYLRREMLAPADLEKGEALLVALKELKVVVVELCGC